MGVNVFTGEDEIEVNVTRAVEATYDPALMKTAEDRQKAKLDRMKRERDSRAVSAALAALGEHAKDESVNLMPDICECVKAEATLQEICDVLRGVFGEAEPVKI